jgi:hypothetical protein
MTWCHRERSRHAPPASFTAGINDSNIWRDDDVGRARTFRRRRIAEHQVQVAAVRDFAAVGADAPRKCATLDCKSGSRHSKRALYEGKTNSKEPKIYKYPE